MAINYCKVAIQFLPSKISNNGTVHRRQIYTLNIIFYSLWQSYRTNIATLFLMELKLDYLNLKMAISNYMLFSIDYLYSLTVWVHNENQDRSVHFIQACFEKTTSLLQLWHYHTSTNQVQGYPCNLIHAEHNLCFQLNEKWWISGTPARWPQNDLQRIDPQT